MKVLYIAAECKPFSKTGGVGDVAGELPIALKKQGVDIEIVTPLYGSVNRKFVGGRKKKYSVLFGDSHEKVEIHEGDLNGVPVNFVKNQTYFEGDYGKPYIHSPKIPYYDDALRFSFFSEAILDLIGDKNPDVVHINDWVLGYLLGRMEMENVNVRKVTTVHNIGYQGNIWKDAIKKGPIEMILNSKLKDLFLDPQYENCVNPLRLAFELSDMVNTVSPTYAEEMTLPEDQERYFEGGKGLHEVAQRLYNEGKLIGILNGFEYKDDKLEDVLSRKLKMKKALSGDFENPSDFLLGFVGRAVEQKFKLLTEQIDGKSVLEHILDIPGVNVAVLATGLHEYESFLRSLKNPNYSATIAFDREKAGQISLGSDVFLMPSLFEPCGITQMESMSSATPPLVRWTGGLKDTVIQYNQANGTGFGFDGQTREEVLQSLIHYAHVALDYYRDDKAGFSRLQENDFNERFLWSDAAKRYVNEMYN